MQLSLPFSDDGDNQEVEECRNAPAAWRRSHMVLLYIMSTRQALIKLFSFAQIYSVKSPRKTSNWEHIASKCGKCNIYKTPDDEIDGNRNEVAVLF